MNILSQIRIITLMEANRSSHREGTYCNQPPTGYDYCTHINSFVFHKTYSLCCCEKLHGGMYE
jgi:hypothetical protein